MNFTWFLLGFFVFAIAERLYETRYSRKADRGRRTIESVMSMLHALYGVIYLGTVAEYFWVGREIDLAVTTGGLVVFLAALVVRLAAIRTLGRFWSLHLEIREHHQLIREGIYAHVRHPAYLAIMLEVIAVPLVANAYWMALFSVAVYIPTLLVRWWHEERALAEKFGQVYLRYRAEVPAFLPLPRARRS